MGGAKNVSSRSIHKLCFERFVIAEIRDKRANICADLPQKELLGTGVFKALVSGDPVETYIKHVQKSRMIEPTCNRRFTFAGFPIKFIPGINAILRPELLAKLSTPESFSEILLWALDGPAELVKNGDITNKTTAEEKKYIKRSETALAYFYYQVTVANSLNDYVFTDEWYRDYVNCCHHKGLKAKLKGKFRTVFSHLPGAEHTKIHDHPKGSPLSARRYVKFVPAVLNVPVRAECGSGSLLL